jgi:antitoxin component of MazEF toxin-antitoxin module
MVIPRSLREEVGVVEGTLMKVAVVSGGQFLVTPQVSIDRAIVANPRKTRKQVLRELAATVSELRREAKAKGLDKLSVREINATVAVARRAHRTTKPRAK